MIIVEGAVTVERSCEWLLTLPEGLKVVKVCHGRKMEGSGGVHVGLRVAFLVRV